jgi:agmatine deiminase
MTTLVPAEWGPHRAFWVGFPSHGELWLDDLEPAQREVADLVRALAGPGQERVRLMVCGEEAAKAARALVGEVAGVEIVEGRFGDIWLRDTGPIFLHDEDKSVDCAAAFRFNGWGGKYILDGDETVAAQIAKAAGERLAPHPYVLEGGALDHDGRGAVLTTRQCLLNSNRNADWDEAQAEAALRDSLGARKVLWLDDGLMNDHTDGHVDNLARFVAPGVVACPVAWGRKDPNAQVYDAAAKALARMTDTRGKPIQVVRIASPGLVEDEDGEPAAASHMNFVIANGAIVAPVYDDADAAGFALDTLKSLFPEREIVGLPSRHILTGGGSFHCITQQEPA